MTHASSLTGSVQQVRKEGARADFESNPKRLLPFKGVKSKPKRLKETLWNNLPPKVQQVVKSLEKCIEIECAKGLILVATIVSARVLCYLLCETGEMALLTRRALMTVLVLKLLCSVTAELSQAQ